MKLSVRSKYGIRMMFEIAKRSAEKPVMLREVAKTQEISEKNLGQLIIPLRGAGLVNSSRGAHGGYFLSRKPEEITIYEIIVVLEGAISLTECAKNGKECKRSNICPSRDLWTDLEELMEEYLKGVTLRTLLDNHSKKIFLRK